LCRWLVGIFFVNQHKSTGGSSVTSERTLDIIFFSEAWKKNVHQLIKHVRDTMEFVLQRIFLRNHLEKN
jgi:hypothetical protein